MDERTTPLRRSVERWAEELRAEHPEHPSMETLIDYHLGELPSGERLETLREHLMVCDECGRFLDDLRQAPDVVVPSTAEVGEETRVAAWQALRDDLQLAPTAPPPPLAFPNRFAFLRSLRFAYGTAALFLITTVLAGLAGFSASGPQVGIVPYDLAALETHPLRDPDAFEVLVVPQRAISILLILHLDLPEHLEEARVEIYDLDDRRLWSGNGQVSRQQGNVSLSLPGRFLPQGRYLVRLSEARSDRTQTLATYPFELQIEE